MREQVGPIVVVVLRPAVEGMVVALGALQSRAEEHLGGRLGARCRITVGTIEVRGGIAVSAAVGGDQLADEPIERLVLSDALANPVVEVLDTFFVERMRFDPQQVRPFQRPKVRELRTLEQPIDESRPFLQPPMQGVSRNFSL